MSSLSSLSPDSLPPAWGVRPVLFSSGNISVESYPFFVGLGLITGLLVFLILSRRERQADERSFFIVFAAIAGGTLGAKLPIWLVNARVILEHPSIDTIFPGRTIVGGLIGGTLAVWWLKRHLKIKRRIGNAIAPAAAIGIAIGRIGCFLRGCCYGIPTSLPWGIDFGDGIRRHPTELYESLFMLIVFVVLLLLLQKKPRPGALFTGFIVVYFLWRFFLEFLRVEPRIFLGLTGYQYAALVVLVYCAVKVFCLERPTHS